MYLHNYKLTKSLLDNDTLILIVDIGQFNKVDIHIDCQDTINIFMNLISYTDWNRKKDIELINEFILENYSDEIDPYRREGKLI